MKKTLVLSLVLVAAMSLGHTAATVKAAELNDYDVVEEIVEEPIEEPEEVILEEEPIEEPEEVILEEEPIEEPVEEIIEEEPIEEVIEEVVEEEHEHTFSVWYFDNEYTHSRFCTYELGSEKHCEKVEYQDHYFSEDKSDISYYTCVCGYENNARKQEILDPIRVNAMDILECQDIAYGKYGRENVHQELESARSRINKAESAEEIQAILAEASERMDEVVIYDARNYYTNAWRAELNDNVYSAELEEILEYGNIQMGKAYSIEDIEKLGNTILNDIREYIAENPYTEPMVEYASQIAGTYTCEGASIVISVNADGEAVVVLKENDQEIIIDTSDVYTVDDAIVIQTGPTLIYTIYMEDGSAVLIHEQNSRKGRDFEKEASENHDPIPEVVVLEAPICPQCGAEMALNATNGDECTWICETAGCGLVSVRHHGLGEICVCAESCVHEYGTEGDERFICIKCGEHVNEAKKAEAEAADAYKALMAEFEAFKMTQKEAVEALGNEETAELVEWSKNAIDAYAFNDNLSLEDNEAAIVQIVNQLAEDIDFYYSTKEPEIGDEIDLAEGTYALFLDDEYVGIYTFAKLGRGWSIQDENGLYLGIIVENKEGYLSLTDVAFEWSYNGGAFRGSDKNGKQYCLASADSVRKPKVEASIHEVTNY